MISKMGSYGLEWALVLIRRGETLRHGEKNARRMKTEIGVSQLQARAAHHHLKLGVSLGQMLPPSPQKEPALLTPGFQTSSLQN